MCFKYDEFNIVEVAKKCGVVFHPVQRNDVEFRALCPFCGDTKYHLGINKMLDRFHCFRCKEKGNSVSLYAKMNSISNKEAYKLLVSEKYIYEQKSCDFSSINEAPIRPIEDRHTVYYDFLKLLRLNRAHRENLERRGLTFEYIHRFMYKSVPTDDVIRREVLENLASMHDLRGIPGFYTDSNGDWQMYFKRCGGIFIPVCNKEGYIQGLQMRLDVTPESGEKKFRWFSSKYYDNGAGAKPWIHVVGDTTAKMACLTEGAMKADITSVLAKGQLFLAVPGVNALNCLPDVIRDLGIVRIYEAMDMDKRSKPEVKQALIMLKTMLYKMGVECVSCSWNPQYKGLDDYLLVRESLAKKNSGEYERIAA